jgi:hypothetical protein
MFAAEVFGFSEGTVTEWTFQTNVAGFAGTRNITPVIFEQSGSVWNSPMTIRGIGTARSVTASAAAQTFDFGLTSGIASMGPRHYLGWIDSDGGTGTNQGVISYGGGCCTLWFGGPGAISVGSSYNPSNLGRTYSLQTTVDIGSNEAVGNTANQRVTLEAGTGGVFVMDDPFTQPGLVNEWATWTFTNGTTSITPLIFEDVAGSYILRGVGTTVTPSAQQGTQTFDFGLQSGSTLVDSNYYFGWVDGSIAADGTPTYNGGNIRYDSGSFDVTGRWFGNSPAFNFTPGNNIGGGTLLPRYYAIQAIASAVPEPSTFLIWALGLVGLALYARRRRTR